MLVPPPDREAPALPEGAPVERPRTAVDLAEAQLRAIDRWHAARRARADTADLLKRTREERLDRERALAVTHREHEAIVRRTQAQLEASAALLRLDTPRRVVVVHRDRWFVEKVCAALDGHGLEVVARLDDGADGVGTCVAEQPDLLLVEDSLPSRTGLEVLQLVRRFSPHTRIGACTAHDAAAAAMLEAGAVRAWTRRVRPGDVGDELSGLVDG